MESDHPINNSIDTPMMIPFGVDSVWWNPMSFGVLRRCWHSEHFTRFPTPTDDKICTEDHPKWHPKWHIHRSLRLYFFVGLLCGILLELLGYKQETYHVPETDHLDPQYPVHLPLPRAYIGWFVNMWRPGVAWAAWHCCDAQVDPHHRVT